MPALAGAAVTAARASAGKRRSAGAAVRRVIAGARSLRSNRREFSTNVMVDQPLPARRHPATQEGGALRTWRRTLLSACPRRHPFGRPRSPSDFGVGRPALRSNGRPLTAQAKRRLDDEQEAAGGGHGGANGQVGDDGKGDVISD